MWSKSQKAIKPKKKNKNKRKEKKRQFSLSGHLHVKRIGEIERKGQGNPCFGHSNT